MDTTARILIVDDFPAIRKILKRILKQQGFEVIAEADNGESAWKILESQQIDLIIADWDMPRMTGLEFLTKIRSSDTHRMIPFLMLTAKAEKKNIVDAVNAGASSYVIKPFTADIITNKIENLLK